MTDCKTKIPRLAADFLVAVMAPVLTEADARLVALADDYESLDRRCNEHAAAHKGLTGAAAAAADTEFDGLVEGYGPIEAEVATTRADSLVGVLAKARLCQVPIARGTARTDHILSVVDDIHRLFGGRHA